MKHSLVFLNLVFLNFISLQIVNAHHSFATHYLYDEKVKVTGTITRVQLSNPHSFFYLDVVNSAGMIEKWEVEANAVPLLKRAGVTKETIKPRDTITLTGMRSRDRNRHLMFGLDAVTSSGDKYELIRPDWNVGAAPITLERGISDSATLKNNISGKWRRIFMQEQVLNLDGESPLPLNDTGIAARASYNPLDTPAMACIPPNLPSILTAPYLLHITVHDEQVNFQFEYSEILRVISLTGQPITAHPSGQYGVSIGKLENGVLHVRTTGFPALKAGLASDWDSQGRGKDVPSSTQKEIIETYRLANNGEILEMDLELTDPVFLSKPFVSKLLWQRLPGDTELEEAKCQKEIANKSTKNAIIKQTIE
jgi:hypothetical protein